MGNDTKTLLIGGAVCVVTLIISIAMFAFYDANGTTMEGMENFSTQEVNTFNSKFSMYEGVQNGTQIKNLIAILISNSSLYKEDDLIRLPQLIVNSNSNFSEIEDALRPENDTEKTEYVRKLSKIRNKVSTTKEYVVELEYANSGIIDKITILPNTN